MRLVTLETRCAAVVRRTVSTTEMRVAQRDAHAALEGVLTQALLDTATRLTVWRRAADRFDYAPGVLVDAGFFARGAVTPMTVPAGSAAELILRDGLEGLANAWAELLPPVVPSTFISPG